MIGTMKEFTTKRRDRCTDTEFISLFPKGKGRCIANQYKGKKQKGASPFKGYWMLLVGDKEGRGFGKTQSSRYPREVSYQYFSKTCKTCLQ